MHTVFVTSWYDAAKMEKNAIAAGWDPKSGDGFLDIYHPEEDVNAPDDKEFRDREKAIACAKEKAANVDFWGQATVWEIEVGGRRCRYCTCHGRKTVRKLTVESDGIIEDIGQDDCLDDD